MKLLLLLSFSICEHKCVYIHVIIFFTTFNLYTCRTSSSPKEDYILPQVLITYSFFFFACALSCTSHVKTVQCLQSTLMYFVFIYSACIHKCCCVAVTSMLIFVRCRLIYVNARVIIIISENEKALKEVWGVFEFFIIILFFISQFFLFLRFMMEDKKREIKSNLFFNKNLAAFFCNSFFYNTVCFFFNYLNLPCFVVLIIDL